MKLEIEEISKAERKVSFEIPSERVDELLTETYRQIGGQVRLKGFRKGRVPRRVLEQLPQYRNSVIDEVQRRLEQSAYEEMFDNHLPEILAVGSIERGSLKKGHPYEFVTVVEVRPELDLEGLENIEINYESVEVEESDIDEVLERKRESKATLEPLERAAEKGDTLKVECTDLTDGDEDAEAKPFEFELGEGPFPAAVQDALVGLKAEETKEITVPNEPEEGEEVDPDEPAERKYHFVIEGVYQRVVPELDDDFAKDEDFDDLAAMRADIREEIEKREKEMSDQRAKESLMKQLLEKHEVPIPPQLLEKHLDSKVQNLMMQLRIYTGGENMNLGNAFREGMRDEAKRDIQNEFILQQVIKNQDIEASKEEIEEELGNIAEKQGRSIAFIKSRYGKEERESLSRKLQRDKAEKYLLEQVTRNEETLTRSARVERLHEERAQEEAAAEHEHSHDHEHDHNCGHDHGHSHDHDHDHK